MKFFFSTWWSGRTTVLTDFRARMEHNNARGFVGVAPAGNEQTVAVDATFEFTGTRLEWTENIDVVQTSMILQDSPELVAILSAAPDSLFVASFSEYLIAPNIDKFDIFFSTDSLNDLCLEPDMLFLPLIDVETSAWHVRGSVRIGTALAEPVAEMAISNYRSIYLSDSSWTQFWSQVDIPSESLFFDLYGRRFSHSCLDIVFPTISFIFGDREFRIEPSDYVFVGTPNNPNTGCTLRIEHSDFNRNTIGVPFLRAHAIYFNAIDEVVGICQSKTAVWQGLSEDSDVEADELAYDLGSNSPEEVQRVSVISQVSDINV